MLVSLRHNLSRLFEFAGRSTRRQFWPFAAMVAVLVIAGVSAAATPTYLHFYREEQYALATSASYVPDPRDFDTLYAALAVGALSMSLLMAAATVRRLHDCGQSGWWALLLALLSVLWFTPIAYVFSLARDISPAGSVLSLLVWYNLTCLIPILMPLAGWPGTMGPNRFGEPLA